MQQQGFENICFKLLLFIDDPIVIEAHNYANCVQFDRQACRDLFATLRGSPIHATHPQLQQLQLIEIEATVVIDSVPLCCYQYAICRQLQLPARHALAQHNSVPPTAHRPTHTENNYGDFRYQLQFSAKFE